MYKARFCFVSAAFTLLPSFPSKRNRTWDSISSLGSSPFLHWAVRSTHGQYFVCVFPLPAKTIQGLCRCTEGNRFVVLGSCFSHFSVTIYSAVFVHTLLLSIVIPFSKIYRCTQVQVLQNAAKNTCTFASKTCTFKKIVCTEPCAMVHSP